MGRVPLIDLVDDTFVVAEPAAVAAVVADPARWRRWWPDLDLDVQRDRGVKGHQWVARSVPGASPRLVGTLEIWLEPWGDGVLVHHYVRLDPHPQDAGRGPTWAARERGRRARAWKRAVHALKDDLERGRPPGTGRATGQGVKPGPVDADPS